MIINILVRERRVCTLCEVRKMECGVKGDGTCIHFAVANFCVYFQYIGGCPYQTTVDIVAFKPVDYRIVVLKAIAEEAICCPVISAQAERQLVFNQWAFNSTLDVKAFVVAVAALKLHAKLVAWLACSRDDCAGGRVTTIYRTLWAFKYLDLAEVCEFPVECRRVCHQNPVKDKRKTVLRVTRTVNTTNIDLAIADLCRIHNGYARRQGNKVFGPLDTCVADCGCRNDRHCPWNVFQAF